MKVRIIWVGKTQERYLTQGIEGYLKKIKPYASLEVLELKAANYTKQTVAECKRQETEKILSKLDSSETSIFLDEHGPLLSSEAFAHQLDGFQSMGISRINLIIGGAYGFDRSLISKHHSFLSVSKMTFTHQMIRLILLEQVYRAFTILKGHPYHHGDA